MADVMNPQHHDSKVKLPSIKELSIGLQQPQQSASASPPLQPKPQTSAFSHDAPGMADPRTHGPLPPVDGPPLLVPPHRTSASGPSSFSSESSVSRNSSVSAVPPYQAVVVPVQTSPGQPYPTTIPAPLPHQQQQQQQPQQPQYVHFPPEMVYGVTPGMPQQTMVPQALPPQQQMVYPVQAPHSHQLPPQPLHHPHAPPPHSILEVHDLPLQPRKKRPRRKANEMVRLYACNYKGCRNSYGTLNHLNAHITFKRHGPKRKPEEFKEIRELYKLQKNLSEKKKIAAESGSLKTEESIKLLADLSEKLIDSDKAELPIFHQQRGYNGYGRFDHTVKKDELAEKLPTMAKKS
ncbi:CYFA0S01e12068g1_1 [Cyberlindnera fabianii]|uniref:CYFA0S01e12068g1_1 n=1 Tax=Cyberlindnera fabianii TaxID=36022 RepID=A0A061AK95_CYBFA|nr:CYFA0S01e12068g1_1 [Cyberlindnera fabianii]